MTITVASDCSQVTLASTIIEDLGPVGVKASGTLTATNIVDGDTVTIGAKTYTFQETLTNVDGNVFITGLDPATGVLQIIGQPGDTETVTIDGKTYTFQLALTNVNGNVAIGASADITRANLVAAINLGAGAGTAYAAATTLHTTVTATDSNPNMTVTYKLDGEIGNGTSTTETVTGWQWVAPTMNGGTNDVETTLENLEAAIDLGSGSGTAYAAAMTAHPTVENVSTGATTITVRAQTEGTAGNAIATTETGGAMSWAQVTLTGGVDEATYTELEILITNADGEETTLTIVEADKTGDDYIVTPEDLDSTGTLPASFYTFTVTSTEPITTGTDENCALVDCDFECEIFEAVLDNLKRPNAARTEYHLMYQSLLNVTECDSCDCSTHMDMYIVAKRDINNPTLLDQNDCGCS